MNKIEEIINKNFKSWNPDSKFLQKTLNYIENITDSQSPDFIPSEDRIAVFDMDGTVLTEKTPTNMLFSFFDYRINNDPSYKCADKEIIHITEIVKNDINSKDAVKALCKIYIHYMTEVFKGMSDDEFEKIISNFANTISPNYNAKYKDLYFEPMRELILYLQNINFTCIINTGNDKLLSYVFLSNSFNIDLKHFIGADYRKIHLSMITKLKICWYKKQFKIDKMVKLIEKHFNIGENKVYSIKNITNKTPIMAFGNDSVDFAMLDYTKQSKYKSLQAIIIHDDPNSEININLAEAEKITKLSSDNKYDTISVKNDFRQLFPVIDSVSNIKNNV